MYLDNSYAQYLNYHLKHSIGKLNNDNIILEGAKTEVGINFRELIWDKFHIFDLGMQK